VKARIPLAKHRAEGIDILTALLQRFPIGLAQCVQGPPIIHICEVRIVAQPRRDEHPSIARNRDIVGNKLPTVGLDLFTEYFFHLSDFPLHFAGDLFCRATVL
jgi:hypothetical protein